jgi:cytidine deaminase
MTFASHMEAALREARLAGERGEVPVGAVVAGPDGRIVAAAGNRTRELCDPTAHAEVLALREACRAAGSERLPGHSLWVTLEPCPMCAAAIGFARIGRLYFGAADPKSGGVLRGPSRTRRPISPRRCMTGSGRRRARRCCATSSHPCAGVDEPTPGIPSQGWHMIV